MTGSCPRCRAPIIGRGSQCPRCRLWDPRASRLKRLIDFPPAQIVRVKTLPWLDEILNGGFLKGGTYLFSGQPGIGKSRLALQICETVSSTYNSFEESPGTLRERSDAMRLCMEDVWVSSDPMGDVICQHELTIVDSLQYTDLPILDIQERSQRAKSTCVIISQITKEGEIRGHMSEQHEVTGILEFDADLVLHVGKHRHGPSFVHVDLEMDALGRLKPKRMTKAKRRDDG